MVRPSVFPVGPPRWGRLGGTVQVGPSRWGRLGGGIAEVGRLVWRAQRFVLKTKSHVSRAWDGRWGLPGQRRVG